MAKSSQITQSESVGLFGIFAPPDIQIECEAFRGSLGLLIKFVKDHKINLLDVPLAPICLAYVEYLTQAETSDLERAAVAATALAYLLERKSSVLLPKNQDDDEPEEEPIDGIDPTIHLFQPAIRALQDRLEARDQLYFRSNENSVPYELPLETNELNTAQLARALEKLLDRAIPDTVQPLGRPRRSLSDQMTLVLKALPDQPTSLDQIVVGEFTRTEAVWWFLALLELIRLGQATVIFTELEPLFGRRLPE